MAKGKSGNGSKGVKAGGDKSGGASFRGSSGSNYFSSGNYSGSLNSRGYSGNLSPGNYSGNLGAGNFQSNLSLGNDTYSGLKSGLKGYSAKPEPKIYGAKGSLYSQRDRQGNSRSYPLKDSYSNRENYQISNIDSVLALRNLISLRTPSFEDLEPVKFDNGIENNSRTCPSCGRFLNQNGTCDICFSFGRRYDLFEYRRAG